MPIWMHSIKLGLERMRALMHQLGDPQDKLKFIHVAGTNGKGSTCTFLASALSANGYKTGMYLSPAVMDVREQFTVNGEWISAEDYAEYAARVCSAEVGMRSSLMLSDKDICPNEDTGLDMLCTEFEIETAMAFLYFYEKGCDCVVLETGLGGEGDATNIVNTTVLSVFTSISEDHLGMIGNDLTEIARTKAGIIKPGIPVVMADSAKEVVRVIRDECEAKGSDLTVVNTGDDVRGLKLSACGTYQKDNAALSLKVLDILNGLPDGFKTDREESVRAIAGAFIPFRMEKIKDDPPFYLDGAHNPDAALRLKDTVLEMFPGYKLIFIAGMFKDKDYREVMRIMVPLAGHIIAVQTPDNERALSADMLRECILETEGNPGEDNVSALEINEAVGLALSTASEYIAHGEKACIIAFGSLAYLKYIKNILKI